jgi:enoyl-CoA hydratase
VNHLVNYVVDRGIATITLNDPPVNAYTHEMMKGLDEAILEARFDDDVHAIVLTGHGDRVFSAGANVAVLQAVDPGFTYYFTLHANETLLRLEHTPKLVVAALNGHCVGGGLEIALACDLRVARKGAGQIALPDINLGLLPSTGGTQRLPRLLGKSRALELILEGTSISFEQAATWGLVNRIEEATSTADFLERVHAYVRRFIAPDGPTLAAGRIKRALQASSEVAIEQGLAIERELSAFLVASEDAAEGLSAYLEKRKPQFGGK